MACTARIESMPGGSAHKTDVSLTHRDDEHTFEWIMKLGLRFSDPKLKPLTVTDAAPEVGPLTTDGLLTTPASNVNMLIMHPRF